MLKLMTPIALVVAIAIAATAYALSSSSSAERADCPGKIVCPLTGEPVCKDRCPIGLDTDVAEADTPARSTDELAEPNALRSDCPDKIVCPLTGELVCEDRCPLGAEKNKEPSPLPSCCQTSN